MPPSRRRHRQPRNLHSSAPSNQPRFMFTNVHQLPEVTLVSHRSQGNDSVQFPFNLSISCRGPPFSYIMLSSSSWRYHRQCKKSIHFLPRCTSGDKPGDLNLNSEPSWGHVLTVLFFRYANMSGWPGPTKLSGSMKVSCNCTSKRAFRLEKVSFPKIHPHQKLKDCACFFPSFCPGVYIKSRCWIPDGSEPMTPPQLQPPILWMESAWRPLKSFPHQQCVALWHHENLHTASWHLLIPEKPLSWYDLNRFPLWICCMSRARAQVLFDWFPIAVVQTQPAAAVLPASRHVPVTFFAIFSFALGPIESVVTKTTLISKKWFVFFFSEILITLHGKPDLEPQSFKHLNIKIRI